MRENGKGDVFNIHTHTYIYIFFGAYGENIVKPIEQWKAMKEWGHRYCEIQFMTCIYRMSL